MLTITDVVTKLIQFNKTERPVIVKLHKRDDHGDEFAEIFVTETA